VTAGELSKVCTAFTKANSNSNVVQTYPRHYLGLVKLIIKRKVCEILNGS
jgi:hypothetical protein